MSTTSYKPTNRDWLRRLLSGKPHQTIGGGDNPYLRRWYVIPRNPLLNVYVHNFQRSDDDRALHDHPWWFVSLMMWGSYTEVTDGARARRTAPEPWRLFFGDRPIVYRPATWRHRVELIGHGWSPREIPCWTLIITGRRSRTWGFWCKGTIEYITHGVVTWSGGAERFIPWQEFGDAGCGEFWGKGRPA